MSATCSRPGCGKTLRSNNTKGVCGASCRSPSAPASLRASPEEVLSKAIVISEKVIHQDVLAKFRTVAEALGKNPDAILSEFAEQWLQALRDQVDR